MPQMDNDTETIVLGSGKKRRKKSQQSEGRPAKRAAASMAPEVPEVRKKKKKKKKLEQQQQPDSGRADPLVAESQDELSGGAEAQRDAHVTTVDDIAASMMPSDGRHIPVPRAPNTGGRPDGATSTTASPAAEASAGRQADKAAEKQRHKEEVSPGTGAKADRKTFAELGMR